MSTNRSKDRSSLCSFTFVDGVQCRTPRVARGEISFYARVVAKVDRPSE